MLNPSVACPAFSISSPGIGTAANSSPPVNKNHVQIKDLKCFSYIYLLILILLYLILGKKQEKVAQHPSSTKHDHRTNHHAIPKVSSHESPAVQAENNNNSNGDNNNNKSAISWEERRKLKFDLEKCDEDLKELKMIIESIRYSDCDRSPLPPSVVVKTTVVDEKCGRRRDHENNKCSKMNEHTSPVSVLDELTRAPLISSIYSRETTNGWSLSYPLSNFCFIYFVILLIPTCSVHAV